MENTPRYGERLQPTVAMAGLATLAVIGPQP